MDHQNETQKGQQQQQFRSPAASLIQSAARSMMDDVTPDSTFSDEEEELDNCSSNGSDGNYFGRGRRRQRSFGLTCDTTTTTATNLNSNSSSPQLSSLEHIEERPVIPEEQDRRRFIGCLAAILASSYDFDEEEEDDYIAQGQKNSEFSYLDYTEELYDDDDDDDDEQVYGSIASDTNTTSSSTNLRSQSSIDSIDAKSTATARNDSYYHDDDGPMRQEHLSIADQRKHLSHEQRAKLAAQRHRKRRYDVLCKLLVSSSELLLLDKSVAKAFLPMLGRVLVPEPNRSSNNNNKEAATTRATMTTAEPDVVRIQQATFNNYNHPEDGPYSSSSGSAVPSSVVIDSSITEDVDRDDVLRPFLESLSPGSGFRCLSLLILQHLLTSEVGYDARIRYVLKKVGVIVLMHDMELDPLERERLPGKKKKNGGETSRDYEKLAMAHAARKFESLEHSIARRLIRLSSEANKGSDKSAPTNNGIAGEYNKDSAREKIVRGVKIGSAGIVAGTLFALTGGLAAPGTY